MNFSIMLTYIIMVVVILFSIGIGFSLGRKALQKKNSKHNPSLGSAIGAMLALLGFMLALTFSMVSSRFAERKQLVLDEANSIGTAILRTDFLEEPFRRKSRQLFVEYVNIRAQFDRSNLNKLTQWIADSEKIQDQLWFQVTKASNQTTDPKNAILLSLYIDSLNEVIDMHSKRITRGVQDRLPRSVWLLLYFVTIQAMLAVGYEFGVNNSGSLTGSLLLALMFSAVTLIILDLDKSADSVLIKISQKPMIELRQKLKSSFK